MVDTPLLTLTVVAIINLIGSALHLILMYNQVDRQILSIQKIAASNMKTIVYNINKKFEEPKNGLFVRERERERERERMLLPARLQNKSGTRP